MLPIAACIASLLTARTNWSFVDESKAETTADEDVDNNLESNLESKSFVAVSLIMSSIASCDMLRDATGWRKIAIKIAKETDNIETQIPAVCAGFPDSKLKEMVLFKKKIVRER